MKDKYNLDKIEIKWRNFWEKEKLYSFNLNSKKEIFSIDTPPPTISGEIHMGHAFSYSHLDFIARYQRMKGRNVFYPFGFDNNGLATERLVEKERKVNGLELGREKFVNLCLEVSKEYENKFREFWGDLGLSVDWSLLYSTIDKRAQRMSQLSFIELYKKEREYQKEVPYMWCPTCQTAIAQVELEDKEFDSTFNDIIFKVEDKDLIIATTRPELLPSCVALFYHPNDKRYKKYKGKRAIVPLFNQEVLILEDKRVNPDKGSGMVMCCLFGDTIDIEWFLAYKLPLKVCLNEDGRLNELAGKYKGMNIKEARRRIIDDLKKDRLLIKQEPIKHAVNVHERCGTEIEFLITKQWFIKYLDLKSKFLGLGNKINWYPSHMKNRYDNWIKGLQWDWCISRQRFYGIPIPVWYCKKCGEVNLPDEKDLPVNPLKDKLKKKCKCGNNEFTGEKDVLDTWTTSSLTPQINCRWKEDGKFFKKIFPMNLRSSAHDIISIWQFNTIVKAYFHNNSIPWKDVMISGWGLDSNGKKMSKSKGNAISPIELLDKYPADALRFWAASSKLGDDLSFQEKELIAGRRMIIKLINASKFCFSHLEDYKLKKPAVLEPFDELLLVKLNEIIKNVNDSFDKYEYSRVKLDVENFFWSVFCDYYLEIVKGRLYNPDIRGKTGKESAQYILYKSLLNILKLLAPIMPYITEELYQTYYVKNEKVKSIHISEFPKVEKLKENKLGDEALEIISKVRKFKADNKQSMKAHIKLTLKDNNLEIFKEDLQSVCNADIFFGKEFKIELK